MKRRTFIRQTGLASASTALPLPIISRPLAPKYKMGLQLFTVRDVMATDPIGTLKAVRELGYEDSEIFGYDSENGTFYGLKAKEFRRVIDDLGFGVSSGHYNFSQFFNGPHTVLKEYLAHCIEGSHLIGAKYITWPWLAPEYRYAEGYKKLVNLLNHMGEQVKEGGLSFAYHNHGFEFADLGGQTGYDMILAGTDEELVKLQMDMYWVAHSSKTSMAQYIAQNPGRYVMWHIKDMDKVTRDYSELGNGSIDYVSLLSQLDKDALEHIYIEQGGNFAHNSIQSITDSAAYFKTHLARYF
ncbi:sugar phosphate isomerase/epimerase family protein [Maribacter sp. 2307ULW6-5]|uniref:sugar phosphate isomerase/epimerase family protein n=1 Tax=Maribacter sp. 2307ULW6-5 TaxID=3386275 RepID=UPI0039BCA31E